MAAKKKAKKSKAAKGVAAAAKAAPPAANGALAPELTGNQRPGGFRRASFVEDLPCKLDAEEIAALRQRLCDIAIDKVRKEKQKGVLSEEIKELGKSEKLVVDQLEDKEVTRPVDCVEMVYPETCSVDVIRLDTGEVVPGRTREATQEDLQQDMDAVIAKNLLDGAIAKGNTVVSQLDAGIARAVANMPPKDAPGAKPPLNVETAKPEDLAPKPGTLGGPGEAARPAPPPADDDDDADGPIEDDLDDDPLGLGGD